MTEHNLFYPPCASLTNAQLPLPKVAAVQLEKPVILDPVGAGCTAQAAASRSWPARRAM